ncbi:MAG: lipopolysaccharide biosynthesis protein [Bryobacteraceae bacterium]|jgi:O-antigen/teichoic acid export membrane protein
MQTRRWLNNSAWSVAGNSFYAFCQWALLMVLAKAGNPHLVGQFAMGLAVSAPLFLFANLQIRAIQSTDLSGEYSFGEYLGLRLLTTLAALLAVCGIVAAAGYEMDLKRVILAVGVFKAVEAVSDVFHGDLQRRERMDSVARYLAVKGSVSVIAVGIAVKLSGSAFAGSLAMAAVFAAVLVFGESRFAVASARVRWNWQAFRRLAVLAFPLGLVMMLISVTTNMPRYFVEGRLGSNALGVFAALTYLSVAGSTVVNAAGLAATPRLAWLYASGERPAFVRKLLWMSVLAALAGIGAMGILALGGKPLLTLIYGSVYAANLDVAIWIMAAGALSYAASVVGFGLTAARCFREQLPLFAIVTVIAACASYLLVPRYGLAGAAFAQIAAAAAQLLYGAAILASALKRPAFFAVAPVEVAA